MLTIDYSQYKTFKRCPLLWWETYVDRWQKAWPERQRDDALALGALVHSMLDSYVKYGTPAPSPDALEELTPSDECMSQAWALVNGYVRAYPQEEFDLHFTEEPVEFPINPGTKGVAKIDAYFYLPEDQELESGIPGYPMVLSAGWWIREYKTKAASVDRALFMQSWQSNMQASFQTLALQHKLRVDGAVGEVQGVMVSVLEKPRTYVPKRKCKGCSELLEMSTYLSVVGGGSACPLCGHVQELTPYNPKSRPEPSYFRFAVTRTQEQLNNHKQNIQLTAEDMRFIQIDYERHIYANYESCIDTRSRGSYAECAFFKRHTYGDQNNDGLVQVADPLRYVYGEREEVAA